MQQAILPIWSVASWSNFATTSAYLFYQLRLRTFFVVRFWRTGNTQVSGNARDEMSPQVLWDLRKFVKLTELSVCGKPNLKNKIKYLLLRNWLLSGAGCSRRDFHMCYWFGFSWNTNIVHAETFVSRTPPSKHVYLIMRLKFGNLPLT